MSRWHHSSCASPLVVVEQNHPTCKSCGNSPDVDALIKAQATRSSIPDLPPDEPHGQYNLWWPPSITYMTEAPDSTRTRVTPPDANGAVNSGSTKTPISRKHGGIYPDSLKSNEFRVLLISAVDDVDYPVHVDLETCDDDRHYEYETVSYTWGGENRDSTPCKPIFIGPYWDILLQTRNCWELLRHLRPPRGLRIVWVDAICINQRDLKEREAQVSKMGRIYRNASRVVLYLGPDLAPPTSSSSQHPIRRNLAEFDSLKEEVKLRSLQDASAPLSLSKIFRREYFKRVWIVQELVLSHLVTFRVGDVEFMVDSRQQSNDRDDNNAANAIVPWFKFVAQRSINGPRGNDLATAVDLIHDSLASDPRDKLFGVLGLTCGSGISLVPAYSISFRHVQLGYFAHCLLVNRDVRVLDMATASKGGSTPSWAPPLSSTTMQPQLNIAKLTSVCINDNVPTPVPGHGLTCIEHIADPSRELWYEYNWNVNEYLEDHRWIYDCVRLVSWLNPDPERVLRYNKMHSIDVCAPQNYDHRCYHFGAALNAESGALYILAVHILSLDQMRMADIKRSQHGAWYIYTMHITSEIRAKDPNADGPFIRERPQILLGDNETMVHLRTNVSNLKDLICQGGIGLFALYEGPSTIQEHVSGESTTKYCLLRRTSEEKKREFELVTASVDICFHLPFTDSGIVDYGARENFLKRVRATPVGFAHNEDELDQYRAMKTIEYRRRSLYGRNRWCSSWERYNADASQMISSEIDRAEYQESPTAIRTYENLPATRYLTMERLRVSRFDLLETLIQRWVTAEGQTEAGVPAGDIPYFVPLCGSFPWPLFAFPNVTRSQPMFAWFREVAKHMMVIHHLEASEKRLLKSFSQDAFLSDSESENRRQEKYRSRHQKYLREAHNKFRTSSSALLKSYLDMVHDFQPRTFEHVYGRVSEIDSETMLTFVQLTFQPEQHHFLKSINEVIRMAKSQEGRGEGEYDDFLYFHLRWKRRSNELDEFDDLNKSNDHGCKGFNVLEAIEQHAGETLWLTFDWATLECWALEHEFIGDWKDLKHYCKDGEDAMELIAHGPTEKDREIQAPRWPREFVERLGIDGSTWGVTIV